MVATLSDTTNLLSHGRAISFISAESFEPQYWGVSLRPTGEMGLIGSPVDDYDCFHAFGKWVIHFFWAGYVFVSISMGVHFYGRPPHTFFLWLLLRVGKVY